MMFVFAIAAIICFVSAITDRGEGVLLGVVVMMIALSVEFLL